MKTLKRVLSVILTVVMILTVVPVGVFNASAGTGGKTRADAIAWAESKIGQSLDQDGWYGAQCVDLIRYYYIYLGASPVKGNACDYAWNALPAGWTRIQDYIGFIPEPGDIAVWTYLTDNFGHVGIITSADGYSFNTIDQRTKTYNPNEIKHVYTTNWKYSKGKFWGVIRPDFANPKPVSYSLSNYSATNISNTSATISFSVSPAANISAWGFTLNGQSHTVSTGNLSCDVATYAGKLKPGTTYSYKTWADIGGKRWESGKSSFTTTNNKPGSFTARISADNADIGIDSAPTVTWSKSNYAENYTAVLYDAAGNTIQKKENISASATQFAFNPIQKAGNYTVRIAAKNTAGSLTANTLKLTVHPDVTVTFVDADPTSFVDFKEGDDTTAEVLGTSTVHYGKNAKAPADTAHQPETIIWSSSNADSASVDETGLVQGLKSGDVIITADDGNGHTATAAIQILPAQEILLIAAEGATTVIDADSHYIYGLKGSITRAELEENYLAVSGNGRLVIRDTGAIGTGTVVDLVSNFTDEVLETYEIVIFGDINGDGMINSTDVTRLRMMSANMETTSSNSVTAFAADVYADGNVNSSDTTTLRMIAANMVTLDQATRTISR